MIAANKWPVINIVITETDTNEEQNVSANM